MRRADDEEPGLDEEILGVLSIIEERITELETDHPLVDDLDEHEKPGLYSLLADKPEAAVDLVRSLEAYFEEHAHLADEEIKDEQGPFPEGTNPSWESEQADASEVRPNENDDTTSENAISLSENSVDLIVTSPPYWQKRDYSAEGQLGRESTPEEYISNLVDTLDHWKPFLRPTGSVFFNLGDTYHKKNLVGIPGRFARAVQEAGWTIRNEIIWAKDNGIPSSASDRLVPRHEPIFHLVLNKDDYYYDLHAYSELYGAGANPGDVWRISHDRNTGGHLAPFPRDLVRRAVTLACPPSVCTKCGEPRQRIRERGLTELNTDRPQARRALEIYENTDELTEDHIRAIQAVGISDAGKAQEFQDGFGSNDDEVERRAEKAKDILGGYFREFTFPKWTTAGWSECDCDNPDYEQGMVYDPFTGSGTTLEVATALGYRAFGTDLDTSNIAQNESLTKYSE